MIVWHEYGLVNAWGILVEVVSVALIVLGMTGIYLWFNMHQERLVETILLATNLSLVLSLIFLLRNA